MDFDLQNTFLNSKIFYTFLIVFQIFKSGKVIFGNLKKIKDAC